MCFFQYDFNINASIMTTGFIFYIFCTIVKNQSIAEHMHRDSWQITQLEISAQCVYVRDKEKCPYVFVPSVLQTPKVF